MRFSYEEAELINSFFENNKNISKEEAIKKLEEAKRHTKELELIQIASNTINKIKLLDNKLLKKIISDIPIDTYTQY